MAVLFPSKCRTRMLIQTSLTMGVVHNREATITLKVIVIYLICQVTNNLKDSHWKKSMVPSLITYGITTPVHYEVTMKYPSLEPTLVLKMYQPVQEMTLMHFDFSIYCGAMNTHGICSQKTLTQAEFVLSINWDNL